MFPLGKGQSPRFGVSRRGSPPISSDLFRFPLFLPICSDLRSLFSGIPRFESDLFRFAPISSDLFRFVFRTNQNKSGKPLSADPFGKSPKRSRLCRGPFRGLFLVGALNRPRKRKRRNRETPRRVPEQIGKIQEKSGKDKKGQKRTKKDKKVQIRKPPRLAALEKQCQKRGVSSFLLFRRRGLDDVA